MELLDSYFGEWCLTRKSSDGYEFDGKAYFEFIGKHQLRLNEVGKSYYPSNISVISQQNWIWKLEPPHSLKVFFDGEVDDIYHDVQTEKDDKAWIGSATHLCIEDTYSATYQFKKDEIIVSLKVEGPEKNYDLTSLFLRN